MNARHVIYSALTVLAAAGFAAMPAFASPITYSFAGGGNLGSSTVTFTQDGITISATGYVGSALHDLFGKGTADTVGDEDGLGLNGTTNDEINPKTGANNPAQSIVFNLSALASAGYTSGTFSLGSLQLRDSAPGDEEAEACTTSNSNPGSVATGACVTGITGASTTNAVGQANLVWSIADPYIEFIADPNQPDTTGNFLVNSLTTSQNPSPTPEPPTLLLFGTALLGLGWVTRKRLTATR